MAELVRRKKERKIMKYRCDKPEWTDNDPCPIDTEEYDDCSECEWAREEDGES